MFKKSYSCIISNCVLDLFVRVSHKLKNLFKNLRLAFKYSKFNLFKYEYLDLLFQSTKTFDLEYIGQGHSFEVNTYIY